MIGPTYRNRSTMIPPNVPSLSIDELTVLAQRLTAIAKRTMDTELADIGIKLTMFVATVSRLSTLDDERFTIPVSEYARSHDVNIRTVQRWCRKGKVSAVRIDGRTWRISDER